MGSQNPSYQQPPFAASFGGGQRLGLRIETFCREDQPYMQRFGSRGQPWSASVDYLFGAPGGERRVDTLVIAGFEPAVGSGSDGYISQVGESSNLNDDDDEYFFPSFWPPLAARAYTLHGLMRPKRGMLSSSGGVCSGEKYHLTTCR